MSDEGQKSTISSIEPVELFQDQDGEWIYGCGSVHPVDGVRCMLLDGHDEPRHEWCTFNVLGRSVGFVQW